MRLPVSCLSWRGICGNGAQRRLRDPVPEETGGGRIQGSLLCLVVLMSAGFNICIVFEFNLYLC